MEFKLLFLGPLIYVFETLTELCIAIFCEPVVPKFERVLGAVMKISDQRPNLWHETYCRADKHVNSQPISLEIHPA